MLNISYQCVKDVVLNNDAAVSAAEAHGMLVGMLCVDGRTDHERWLDAVFEEGKAALLEGERDILLDLCEETRRLLAAIDFSFELFLPDDESPLRERANALSEWCRGFLRGLGRAAEDAESPGDFAEILGDLRDVSNLDSNATGDADEEAYMEISEFVRIGVQLIHSELQRQQKPPRLH